MESLWQERIRLGRSLAPRAGEPEIDYQLITLAGSDSNTAVSFETACALWQQNTPAAVRVLVLAHAVADVSTRDWLGDAREWYGQHAGNAGENLLRQVLDEFRASGDERLVSAAHEWDDWYRIDL